MHQHTQDIESAFGIALEAAITLLTPSGGKVVCIQNATPSIGKFALKNRENVKLYGSDKEHEMLRPGLSHYKDIAVKCALHQIAIDMLCVASNHRYCDVATLSQLCRHSAGEFFWISSSSISMVCFRLVLYFNKG